MDETRLDQEMTKHENIVKSQNKIKQQFDELEQQRLIVVGRIELIKEVLTQNGNANKE